MTRTAPNPVKVFFSYSHKDEEYLDELKTNLAGLRWQGLVEEWHDREILPGHEWDKVIDENLKTSEIILLLVTAPFINSRYIYEKEMKWALDRHERGEARVIPIIVRPTDWEWAPFGKLQALPKNAKPITTWPNQDEAWLDVIRGIRKAVEELASKPSAHEQEAALAQRTRWGAEPIEQVGDREDLLRRYRESVEWAWADEQLHEREVERLRALANELSLSTDTVADIEIQIIGDTKEAILERQTRDREEEERRNRLGDLYAQAQSMVAIYDQGLRHMQAEEWQQALRCFEEIQRLKPGYRETETLLSEAWYRVTGDRDREEVSFQEADRRYVYLKQQYDNGSLSLDEFHELLKAIAVQDAEGRWWAKTRETGEWHYHNGNTWIRSTPPGYTK